MRISGYLRHETSKLTTTSTATITPTPPRVRVSVGITGHRVDHAGFANNSEQIAATLTEIFAHIDKTVAAAPTVFGAGSVAPTRFHSLLANGADQMASDMALHRGWELVAPIPFGRKLNEAINAAPTTVLDARALLEGRDAMDPQTQSNALAIRALTDRARTFELADADDFIATLYLEHLSVPLEFSKAQRFTVERSERAALAGKILVEQSDIVIGVWDGLTTAHVGGTGHTIEIALELGAPVIWIDPGQPNAWRILRAPESLTTLATATQEDRCEILTAMINEVLLPIVVSDATDKSFRGVRALDSEKWRAQSNPLAHAYRRVETMFGADSFRARFRSIKQTYETGDAIAVGSAADMMKSLKSLLASDPPFVDQIEEAVLRRFAWADGISSRLSDSYRGGMTVSFVLSALAIVGGVSYLPLVKADHKWFFALFEFLLLSAILTITFVGSRRRWHARWFETRRVAEYFRHSPVLLALGVARPSGRWPRGTTTSWPEWYARYALREIGLPRVVITPGYLRAVLTKLLDDHVTRQRDYHLYKAKRLTNAHRNLDRLSVVSFQLGVASVGIYLLLKVATVLGWLDDAWLLNAAKIFTVLGVLFPTFGGAIAGIRYFGDFERFAAISEVTAEKLGAVQARIEVLQAAPDATLHYSHVAELGHVTDDIVVSEIENWQAVFGGKHITVPV